MRRSRKSAAAFTGAILASAVLIAATAELKAPETVAERQIFSQAWRKKLGPTSYYFYRKEELSTPVADGAWNRIFLGNSAGRFYSVNPADGEIFWEFDAVDPACSTPLVTDTTVYFGTDGGALFAVAKSDGSLRWKYQAEAPISAKPLESGGILFFSSMQDALYALDAETGKYIWHHKREIPFTIQVERRASPVLAGSNVVAAFASGYVASFDMLSGDIAWERKLAGPTDKFSEVSDLAVKGGSVYAAVFSRLVFSLKRETGEIEWKAGVNSANLVSAMEKGILVSGNDGMIFSISAEKGEEGRVIWSKKLAKSGALTRPLLAGKLAVVGSSTGGLFVVEKNSGALLQVLNVESGVSGMQVLLGKSLFLLSNGGFLYKFDYHGDSAVSRSVEDNESPI